MRHAQQLKLPPPGCRPPLALGYAALQHSLQSFVCVQHAFGSSRLALPCQLVHYWLVSVPQNASCVGQAQTDLDMLSQATVGVLAALKGNCI